MKKIIISSVVAFLCLSFYILFLNHVDVNEIGVSYDSMSGRIQKQEVGWHVTPPWVKATTIPTVPLRVEIVAGSRFILPKIVKFNPEHLEEFVKVYGFHYYGGQGVGHVFAQFAFSGHKYSFLDEITEAQSLEIK